MYLRFDYEDIASHLRTLLGLDAFEPIDPFCIRVFSVSVHRYTEFVRRYDDESLRRLGDGSFAWDSLTMPFDNETHYAILINDRSKTHSQPVLLLKPLVNIIMGFKLAKIFTHNDDCWTLEFECPASFDDLQLALALLLPKKTIQDFVFTEAHKRDMTTLCKTHNVWPEEVEQRIRDLQLWPFYTNHGLQMHYYRPTH
jgi:hypothetical protein